jgi:hypothetical protein
MKARLTNASFGYVNRYYRRGEWNKLPPWQEQRPPLVVLAGSDKDGRLYHNSDAKTHGYYDVVLLLIGETGQGDHRHSSFSTLWDLAKKLRLGSTFKTEVWVFDGSRDLPALMTFANSYSYGKIGHQDLSDFVDQARHALPETEVWAEGRLVFIESEGSSPQ